MSLGERKADHIRLTIGNASEYSFSAGFDDYRFRHNALPEKDLNEINCSGKLLGRTFRMPLFISSMTGGFTGATQVNEIIASVCQELNLPFGVGSQRAILEDKSALESFSIVRKVAPDAFIAGNIGGAQLIGRLGKEQTSILIDSIMADALIVHLNPLQELMQPEGDQSFKGILDGIASLKSNISVPLIVKETGAGINASVAKTLLDAGVDVIDVAGAGGTSWAKVENLRKRNAATLDEFNEWGIPTTQCIIELRQVGLIPNQIIASGGIRNAHDIIKCICLGAGFTATAQPVIASIHHGGRNALMELLERWYTVIQYTLLLLGCDNIEALQPGMLYTQKR